MEYLAQLKQGKFRVDQLSAAKQTKREDAKVAVSRAEDKTRSSLNPSLLPFSVSPPSSGQAGYAYTAEDYVRERKTHVKQDVHSVPDQVTS